MIEDLNETPEGIIAEARELSGLERIRFMWSQVHHKHRKYLDIFFRDVVDGDADVRTWKRGRVFVPEFALTKIVVMSVSEIVDPLRPLLSPPAWGIIDRFGMWEPLDHCFGAPAIRKPDVHYSFTNPDHVTGLNIHSAGVKPVQDIDLCVRRWMAYRAAIYIHVRDEPLDTVEKFAADIEVNMDQFSPDGLEAARKAVELTENNFQGQGLVNLQDLDLFYP